jgi:DNA invertase Pin-like site-specific DNA recombinase
VPSYNARGDEKRDEGKEKRSSNHIGADAGISPQRNWGGFIKDQIAKASIQKTVKDGGGHEELCDQVTEVEQQIVEMALNGSGIRDTARVLGVSSATVTTTLRKKRRRFIR